MKNKVFLFLSLLTFSFALCQAQSPKVILGYLYLFPEELGVYSSVPTEVIAQVNSQKMYNSNVWHIPTSNEVSLIRSRGYCDPSSVYITSDGERSGRLILVYTEEEQKAKAQKESAVNEKESKKALYTKLTSQNGYIDLGLPSRTKWESRNKNNFFTYDRASQYNLPTKSQWEELRDYCKWTYYREGNGYFVEGRNGNAIFLRGTRGWLNAGERKDNYDGVGYYWSSTYDGRGRSGESYSVFCFDSRSFSFSIGATYNSYYVITVSR